ncbi:hypothetical protein JYU34_014829 [Plutella xylostella]|uniref:Uncharacterized protein n=1 Tax=Plutella xylostella TaxID=51655 RepID=A0ABQ7QAL0_PLUXY|nr:hypothetical protein JYU34_014829 [Plutella xylostella]
MMRKLQALHNGIGMMTPVGSLPLVAARGGGGCWTRWARSWRRCWRSAPPACGAPTCCASTGSASTASCRSRGSATRAWCPACARSTWCAWRDPS